MMRGAVAGAIVGTVIGVCALSYRTERLQRRIEVLEREVHSQTWNPRVVFSPVAPSGSCRMEKVLVMTQNDGQFVCENNRIQFVEVAK